MALNQDASSLPLYIPTAYKCPECLMQEYVTPYISQLKGKMRYAYVCPECGHHDVMYLECRP